MRNRRIGLALIALALLVLAARHHPSADIRILTHEAGDTNPQRIHAAIDMGLAAVNLVVTWTAQRAIR